MSTTIREEGKKAIKNWLNSEMFPKEYEMPVGVSKTIPDQTMTLRELLERFARGLPISGEKFPIYHGEEEMPNLKTMDLSEIADLRADLDAFIEEKKMEYQTEEEEKRQQEIDRLNMVKTQFEEFQKWENEKGLPVTQTPAEK